MGSAFNIFYTNIVNADATAVPFVNLAGDPIPIGSGYVMAGIFPTTPIDETSLSSFTPLSDFAPSTVGTTLQNRFGAGGFFDQGFSIPIPQGSTASPVGAQIYLVIANGPTINLSNQAAIIDTGRQVGTEDGFGNGEVNLILTSTTFSQNDLIFGEIAENVEITSINFTFDEVIILQEIPEPSSLLLTLFGVPLLVRRKRA